MEGFPTEKVLDGVICTMGLTSMTRQEDAFADSFALLKPGGCFAILDRYVGGTREDLPLSHVGERADITRRVWEPLEQAAQGGFEMRFFDISARVLGGNLYLASGQKPA